MSSVTSSCRHLVAADCPDDADRCARFSEHVGANFTHVLPFADHAVARFCRDCRRPSYKPIKCEFLDSKIQTVVLINQVAALLSHNPAAVRLPNYFRSEHHANCTHPARQRISSVFSKLRFDSAARSTSPRLRPGARNVDYGRTVQLHS